MDLKESPKPNPNTYTHTNTNTNGATATVTLRSGSCYPRFIGFLLTLTLAPILTPILAITLTDPVPDRDYNPN